MWVSSKVLFFGLFFVTGAYYLYSTITQGLELTADHLMGYSVEYGF